MARSRRNAGVNIPSSAGEPLKISISKASGTQIFNALNITNADVSRPRKAVAAATGVKPKSGSRSRRAAGRGSASRVKTN